MSRLDLISYASDFSSFLLRQKELAKGIDKIILFGSVARGDFDEESDVDIFIDVPKMETGLEKEIYKILKLYNSSKQKEFWEMKGIKNSISLKVGMLDEWKIIKRSILTDGIVLYGKYEELPKGQRHFALFALNFEKMKRSEKVSVWRRLYGYRQKIGGKVYETKGLASELGGKRLGKGIMIIPIRNIHQASSLFRKHRITYSVYEIWSDSFEEG